ncbi:MAG: flagellar hook-length control protein FliK [Ignavibacteriaceae bacterium]|jgi:flagellar hook-length control protein FliK
MFFNPLFMQPVSEAGAQAVAKSNKLSNSKYLFSEIIKVFNESDPTQPGTVLPESTNVSATPDAFAFQATDISNGGAKIDFSQSKPVEEEANQNIFELITSMLLTNGAQIEQLQKEAGTVDQSKKDSGNEKEFVVQPENLLEILNQLLSVNTVTNYSSPAIATTGDVVLGESTKTEDLLSKAMQELKEKGAATIEVNKDGKIFQFTISKIDAVKLSDNKTVTGETNIKQSIDPLLSTTVPVENSINAGASLQPVTKEFANEVASVLTETAGTVKSEDMKNNTLLTGAAQTETLNGKVESATNEPQTNSSEYKIVVQVSENQTKSEVATEVTLNAVSKGTEAQQTTLNVVSFKSEVQPLHENELPYSPKFTIEGNKVNVAVEQSKIDPADINLLNVLAGTKDKLSVVSKPDNTKKVEAFVEGKVLTSEVKQPVELFKTLSHISQDQNIEEPVQNKNSEKTITGKPLVAQNEKEVSIKISDNLFQNKINSESTQTEPQTISKSTVRQGELEIQSTDAVQVLNEPLQAKTKQANGDKKNDQESLKTQTQKEAEQTVVKGVLPENESRLQSGDVQDQKTPGSDVNPEKEAKHSETKPLPGSEETKPTQIQNAASNNHQSEDLKISSTKEKIVSENFRLPETEKTVKGFELTKEISKLFESGTSQKVVLKLLPEALGKVRLTLEVGGEIIHAKAEVENESVKQILQTNTETLKQALSQNGLQLASFSVSLSGSDDKQQKANGQKKRTNNFGNKSKTEKLAFPEATRKLGYNTYEYLA